MAIATIIFKDNPDGKTFSMNLSMFPIPDDANELSKAQDVACKMVYLIEGRDKNGELFMEAIK